MAGPRALIPVVFLIYCACPPFTSFDSYWTVPTALSLMRHGSTAVDEYVAGAPAAAGYALEHGPDGHWYNRYPETVPVLALPLVAVARLAAAVTARLPWVPDVPSYPPVAAFLHGDVVGGHALVELWCAAVFGVVAVWLQYRIAVLFLPGREAMLLTLVFAFGTSEWSIGSRNLGQHGLTALLLSLALYLLLTGREELSALPLALAFTVRPSNAISVAALTVYVALHHRERLVRFLLWALPVAIPFFAYNLVVRRHLFATYFLALPDRYPDVAAHFFSPSRGLLIFAPVVAFSIAGMVIAWRGRWCFPLTAYLIAIVSAHTLLVATMWEGHSYGPRYFADMNHLFVFFLIPLVLHWRAMRAPARRVAAAAFLLVAGWGVFVNARGATSIAAIQWSALPVSVDDAPGRVWDWSDPQFLRGL